jgi:hypothetical protein
VPAGIVDLQYIIGPVKARPKRGRDENAVARLSVPFLRNGAIPAVQEKGIVRQPESNPSQFSGEGTF